MSQPCALTLSDAAIFTGMSRVTMRRYLDRGRFPNAYRDDGVGGSPWLIPVADLERATGAVADTPDRVSESADEVALRQQLAVADAVAAERLRTIEILDRALTRLHETAELVAARTPEDV